MAVYGTAIQARSGGPASGRWSGERGGGGASVGPRSFVTAWVNDKTDRRLKPVHIRRTRSCVRLIQRLSG